MVMTFPTGPAQYMSLVIMVAAISVGLSSMLPVRWGWRAFPLVAMVPSAVALLALAGAVVFAGAVFKDHGYSFVILPRTALIIVAVAGVVFSLTLSARRRAS